MSLPLAQTTIPPVFYQSGGGVNESRWWNTLCQAVDRCDQPPARIISILLPNILIGAGLIFFGMILVGGFGMIGGAGKESSPQSKAKSQAAITYGVIGFLLVISAFFILQVVSTVTGINFILPRI